MFLCVCVRVFRNPFFILWVVVVLLTSYSCCHWSIVGVFFHVFVLAIGFVIETSFSFMFSFEITFYVLPCIHESLQPQVAVLFVGNLVSKR